MHGWKDKGVCVKEGNSDTRVKGLCVCVFYHMGWTGTGGHTGIFSQGHVELSSLRIRELSWNMMELEIIQFGEYRTKKVQAF